MYEESTTREKVLKKVRKALIHKGAQPGKTDFDSRLFSNSEEPLEIIFARQLSKLNGKFMYCENEKELLENISLLVQENKWQNIFCFEKKAKEILKKAKVPFSENEKDICKVNMGISLCEYLVARTGSVLMSSKQNSGRRLPAFANYHLVIAYSSQLVHGVQDALSELKKKYGTNYPSMIVNVSGPSRTADIEKTLVQGAHGPKEIYVFLTEDRS